MISVNVLWKAVLVVAALIGLCLLETASAQEGLKVTPEIKNLMDKGDYREAERIALQQQPNEPTLIAWLKAKGGKLDEAIKYLEQSKSLDINADSAEEVILEITAIIADSSHSESIRLLESYLNNEALASRSSLWLRLLLLYAGSPNPQEGEEVAKRVLALNPDPDALRTPLYEYCVSLYTHGHPKEALTYYLELRERVPEAQIDPGYQLQFAHLLTADGRPLDSLATVDRIRSDFKDYAKKNNNLLLVASGLAYEALGDEVKAKKEFETLIENGGDSEQAIGFMQLAKDKIRNYENNEKVRQLVDDSEDVPQQDISEDSNGLRVVFLAINALVVIGLVLYLLARRMRKAAK